MNNVTIIFTLVLFLLAPSVSANNNRLALMQTEAVHSMASCAETLNCVTSVQQCCVSGSLSSLYLQTVEPFTTFAPGLRTAYTQTHQKTLLGSTSPRYRPPIA